MECKCAKCGEVREIVCRVDGEPWCEECLYKALGLILDKALGLILDKALGLIEEAKQAKHGHRTH